MNLSDLLPQSLWNNSSNSGWNTWSNQGGDFFNDFGNIGVNSTTENSTFYESLPNITISSSFSNSQRGVLIQDHVYKSASGYQYFRDGLRETQLDNLQSGLDIIGMVPIIGEPFDLINAGISYSRGNYVEGSLSLAATIPLIGVGATTAKIVAKEGIQYTKSNLKLGQEMHKAYKVGANGSKEFRLPSGKRIDFLDINNATIYELKPFNPRAMKAGQKQLNIYKSELERMQRFKGVQWKTVLDTY
ncbi:hypothetical protein ACPDHL_16075 [Myroides sp. C15-4]|uniref:hypothetical protein n=1 Tax=Myroides sp. C15-4 TaxID=3400532 RepID=UPI003D2F5AC0